MSRYFDPLAVAELPAFVRASIERNGSTIVVTITYEYGDTSPAADPDHDDEPIEDSHECPECAKRLPTVKGLRRHRPFVHAVESSTAPPPAERPAETLHQKRQRLLATDEEE